MLWTNHTLLRGRIVDPSESAANSKDLSGIILAGHRRGAVQVYADLTLVNKTGVGLFVGFTVTASLIISLLIGHFGWFRRQPHPLNASRVMVVVLLAGGIGLIAKI